MCNKAFRSSKVLDSTLRIYQSCENPAASAPKYSRWRRVLMAGVNSSGLANLRQCAEQMNGALSIETPPGGGTLVGWSASLS